MADTILDDERHWYKDAIIYELHIKAFCDGNGDGVGDFQGLMQKLDYLQDLGVTAIWLLPFYPSPLKDDGYDISDYYSVNPSYGDIARFKALLKAAHQRNLKVITELVINHTSDQHPWFQRARHAPKGSPEREFYVWSDDPEKYKDVRIIFQDFEASNWTWDPLAEQYYWHRFFHHQPDLNYDNPKVQAEVFRIIDYWCKMGVDGFRLDAVPYLFEREGTNGENLPETHAFLKELRAHIDQYFPGTVFLAEANMWPEDSVSYFGDGDECHMNYHFPVMPRMFMALQMEDRYPITDIFDQTPAIPPTCQWAIFLRNHDELTLEMVTDEERDYMYKAYARDPKAKINLGIRHRLAPLMDNNRSKIELLNSLLFSLPGTPVIYYGDEIGMGDNFYLGDRDGVRTPMQWSADRNAGFSAANPQKLYLPLILDPDYHYESVNVESQVGNTSSLYWFMKRLIGLRKKFKGFGRGDLRFLNVENPKVLAYTRGYEQETLLIVVNLSKFAQAADVDLRDYKGYVPVECFSKNRFPVIREEGMYFFTMAPYTFQWFLLEKAHPEMDEAATVPLLITRKWEDLLEPNTRRQLEGNILPRHLQRAKWFPQMQRSLYSVTIRHAMPVSIDGKMVLWLLLEVNYQTGPSDLYQLPVGLVKEEEATRLQQTCPEAILAKVHAADTDGLLADAFYVPEWQSWLLQKMAAHRSIHTPDGRIEFYGNGVLKKYLQEHEETEVRPKLHASDVYNASVVYDNTWFLKMYRKVELSVNPDLELNRYLSKAGYAHIPSFIGAVEWKLGKGCIVLGILQEMIENHGDGRSYCLERINNYIERILAGKREDLHPEKRLGTLTAPPAFAALPEPLQVLVGPPAAEMAKLLGIRTGEMHLALRAAVEPKEFRPEPFSLHYQRSLFSSMQSQVRQMIYNLSRFKKAFPPDQQEQVERIMAGRTELLARLKKIYTKRLDIQKIRIHGNFHLGQVLMTGKDLAIRDFSGDPILSYSERRLRRCAFVDLAAMVASIFEVAEAGFMEDHRSLGLAEQDIRPFAIQWAHYMSGFFIGAWLETTKGSLLIPERQADLDLLLDNYLLQRAIQDFNTTMNRKPDKLAIPLMISVLL
ncbi:MAG: maltose alpha-D-glucosyltransferase [Bacteroidota bacterium]|nr:maltose alpha-D-glucosyltransferase [Bacteroidota bacterium]MDP4259802.1 maltose alpha-D-glucosyltransferase [Bacteroidota bacterium]